MEKKTRKLHGLNPRLRVDSGFPEPEDKKSDRFMKDFTKVMKELFPKPAEQPAWTMPGMACFSVTATVDSQTDAAEFHTTPLDLRQVGSVVADKAGEFCRYLALELRPGETLTVTVERHDDVPFSQAAPVVMPR